MDRPIQKAKRDLCAVSSWIWSVSSFRNQVYHCISSSRTIQQQRRSHKSNSGILTRRTSADLVRVL